MQHESKLHVFALVLLVYIGKRVKKKYLPLAPSKIPIISPKLILD